MSARSGSHGAQNNVSGTISNGVTWFEEVLLTDENGAPLTGVDGDEWQFQFRKCPGDNADLRLSTADGTLTITEEIDRTVMLINCPQPTIAGMCGDYIADLVSKSTGTGRLIHRAHGTVTFRDDPLAF